MQSDMPDIRERDDKNVLCSAQQASGGRQDIAKKINLAVLGLDFGERLIGYDIAEGPGNIYFNLTAVCDRERHKADKVADKYGVKAYYDLESLLKDDDIQAICLIVSPVGRAELIHKIIKAGKDVMTTKPFEADPNAAGDVLAEAARLGRVVHANSPGPSLSEDLKCIDNWCREYHLGRSIFVHWYTWCSYREKSDGTWQDSKEMCPLGSIARLGIYGINDILHFFSKPKWLQVMGSRIFTERPTCDTAEVSIRFENGAMATIFASFCISDGVPYPDSMIIGFENGVVYRNVGAEKNYPRQSIQLQLQTCSGPEQKLITDMKEIDVNNCSGKYQWEAFYRAIHGKRYDEAAYADQVVSGLRVINAIRRAEASGKREWIMPHSSEAV